MRIQELKLCRGAVLGALVLLFSCVPARAQTAQAETAAVQTTRVPARITEAVDEANLATLHGNVHRLARPEFDQGAVSDAQPLTRMLLLLQRSAEQETALRQLLEEQQNKGSKNYHGWLTPEQFGKQFGPADEDVQAVTSWLESHGFTVSKVAQGRTVIEFSGNAGQVRDAFHTEMHRFVKDRKEHFANARDPQIPTALAPVVKGVAALHNFRPQPMVRRVGTFRRTASGEVRPLFTYTDSNGTFFGVGPADFAKIYNVPVAFDGTGQSIAIVGQTNINIQDVRDFRSMFGLPPKDPQIILNGADPGLVSGDETESDLDVEWAGAVAPGATIKFVVSETTQSDLTAGIDASALYIVDNNVAPVLSESYGACEAGLGNAGNAFYNALWQQATAEGITVVIAAGDNGSAACDPAGNAANQDVAALGLAVSGLASTPYNVALGGTDFDDKGKQTTYWNSTNSIGQVSAKGYIPETTWNDSCAAAGASGCTATVINKDSGSTALDGIDVAAGSGGPSTCVTQNASGACTAGYAKPSWQTSFGDAHRDIPDVSLFSSDGQNASFYIICESDQNPSGAGCNLTTSASSATHDFQGVGGTSAATPAFAAIMALVNEKTGQRQGNANYVLYALAKSETFASCNSSTGPGATCVFNDITKGNISVACQGGSPNCSNTSSGTGQFGILATAAGGSTPAFAGATGYDLATGLGSVNVTNLVNSWASPSRTASTTALSLSSNAFTVDTGVTVSGSVAPATATGIVSLYQGNTSTGAVIDSFTLSSGSYSGTTTFLPAGSYTVIAHYGGDGTFAASDSAPQAVTVAKQNSQVAVSFVTFNGTTATLNTGSQSVAYGTPYILRVDVENASGTRCQDLGTGTVSFVCPTGTIQLLSNGSALNDFPNAQTPNATNVAKLNDRGFTEDQPIQLAPGSYSITAAYAADANSSYNSNGSSNTLSVTVTKATTASAVTPSATSVASGGSVTLTANITTNSNGAGATGTVQFKNGSSTLSSAVTCTPTAGSSAANASCTAMLTTTLSFLTPPAAPPRYIQNVPVGPLWVAAGVLLMIFLLSLKRVPVARRRGYAYSGALLFAGLAAGIAGCGGGSSSSSGGSTAHSDSITAVYSGDANYAGSTSAAVAISIK